VGCLSKLVESLADELPKIADNFEVILVNDGSVDSSWRVIVELAKVYSWIRGLNLMRNYGQHNALLCGIRAARYPITITMDDDQQNPPLKLKSCFKLFLKIGGSVWTSNKGGARAFQKRRLSAYQAVIKQALGAKTAPDVSAFRASTLTYEMLLRSIQAHRSMLTSF